MRQIGYLGLSLLLILAMAAPGLAQADANDYRDFYSEANAQKKIAMGEKFITDYKDSQFRQPVYQTVLQLHVQAQNWAKVMETVDKLPTILPDADAATKAKLYQFGLAAAQQLNNPAKVIDFGDKILASDPNNLNAQLMVASTILIQLPTSEPAKKAAIAKAVDLATKGLAVTQTTFAGPKPAAYTDAQWTQAKTDYEEQLHAALGQAYYNSADYTKAAEQYEMVTKSNPKDGAAHFYLGLIYRTQASDAFNAYSASVKEENDAKKARPVDQPLVDELVAKREGLEAELREKRDKAIEELVTAVAMGGVVAQQARPPLEGLYKTKNNDSLDGLDKLIAEKKGTLGE